MSICCVYKITSPTGRIYIGSTKNYERRIYEYKNFFCKAQPKVYNSLRKHGFNNHQFEIVIECVESDLYKYERMYGEFYDVLNKKNLNLSLPGYDEVKGIASEETKAKLSASLKGRKLSEEHKAKMREKKLSEEHKAKLRGRKWSEEQKAKLRGRKWSEERKAKMIAALKGRKFSEETKDKISAANKGRKRSEETKAKLSALNKGKKLSEEIKAKMRERKKYYFLCNQTGIFYTISELSKILNLNGRTINNYIRRNKLHKIPYQLV